MQGTKSWKIVFQILPCPFLDNMPIKECLDKQKDESEDGHRCSSEKVLQKLEAANLTFSKEKFAFGHPEILVVGHLCGTYGRKPSPSKVNVIQEMKEACETQTKLQRFLGACAFYHILILHYAHVAEPLYKLRINKTLSGRASIRLQSEGWTNHWWKHLHCERPDYSNTKPTFVTVDTSPTGIGWVINQEDEDKNQYAIRFRAKVLSERQRKYAQVKRELWGIVSAIKCDRDNLIGAKWSLR